MDDNDTPRSLDDVLSPGTTLMVGTSVADGSLEFRPLTAARIGGPRIEILLDTNEEWVSSFSSGDTIHATVSDDRNNTWASLRGTGSLSTDAALIDELWNPFAAAYFDEGRESPGIAVLTIVAIEGRYWSTTSGRLGSLISMVKAKFGSPSDSGEHGDIAL